VGSTREPTLTTPGQSSGNSMVSAAIWACTAILNFTRPLRPSVCANPQFSEVASTFHTRKNKTRNSRPSPMESGRLSTILRPIYTSSNPQGNIAACVSQSHAARLASHTWAVTCGRPKKACDRMERGRITGILRGLCCTIKRMTQGLRLI
jgi:hypothetical protein